jgi:1-acyl-sn-glycerol-3-phosphate acyltransferase
MSDYHVPLVNQFARRIIRPLFKFIFFIVSKVELKGFENIPDEPYILIFNHVSLYEAPLIVAYWPTYPEVLGASDVWNRPGQNILAKSYGGIPIDRGEVDRKAMHKMVDAVLSGRSLMIAPEGGRSHTPGMRKAKGGITYLFEKTNAKIVPVGLVGATDDFLPKALRGKRPNVSIEVGKPFVLPHFNEKGKSGAELRQEKVDYVMKRIAEILPEEYRGYYS